MNERLDRWMADVARRVARQTSRRGFLARLATVMVGGATIPLLPISRAHGSTRAPIPGEPPLDTDAGDPSACAYWRHCAIDGFLCSCCGGTQRSCPPGTEMSPVTWIGTCRNPADGNDYVVSYNDCCGSTLCLRCQCLRTEGEKPPYVLWKSNSLLWCFGTKSRAVHCSVSVVLGIAK